MGNSFSIYDGVSAFSRKANAAYYQGCKTSCLNNPAMQILTPKGKETLVRQYNSGYAGTYDKTKGWMNQYGQGTGVEWKAYRARHDRAKVLTVDAIDELQSYANGMTPSINLLGQDFLDNQMPQEMDASNISSWYNQVPLANRHTSDDAGYSVEVGEALNTVLQLQQDVYNSGYSEDTILFMSSDVYANFQKDIIANYGLASNVLMTRKGQIVVNNGLADYNDGEIAIDVEFITFNKFLIVVVPKNRMYSDIILYDGYSVGQEVGGYVPDYLNPDFAEVKLLAIPMEAGFANVRYMIDNYLVPATMYSDISQPELRKINERMYGNVSVGFAGINQKANAFEFDIRIIYDAYLFDNRARNCFAVTGPVGEPNIPVNSIEITGTPTISTNDGTTQLTATVKPDNATTKAVTWKSYNTSVATVNASGLVTAVANGKAVIKATATDGSGVQAAVEVTVSNQT